MMLPTITVGGELFYDISTIVTSDQRARPSTKMLAVHHSVGQQDFHDLNQNGTNQDEEIDHIKAINDYHVRVGYGGFGYNAICFGSGRVYVVGLGLGQRAHVAHRNHELEGICLAGDFTTAPPPLGAILAAGRWIKAKEQQHGRAFPVMGHRQLAVPGWGTSCPGSAGLAAISKMEATAEALKSQDRAALERQIRETIYASLRPAAEAGDLDTLAKQIAFISGNKLCAA